MSKTKRCDIFINEFLKYYVPIISVAMPFSFILLFLRFIFLFFNK